MSRWFLDSLEISGGFLAGIDLRLARGLTCIIGPRGSGKSTLVEAIRYGITGPTGAGKTRQDLIHANLTQAVITLRTSSDDSRDGYTIRRTYRQPASLVTTDGKTVASVDLDRGTFLPLDAYSSSEIEAIADEALGEKRRLLLDELKGEDLHRIQLSLAEKKRALEANADSIRSTHRQIADLTEQIEELSGARARLEALPKSSRFQASQSLVDASQQHGANEQERSLLAQADEFIRSVSHDFIDLANRIRRFQLISSNESKNKPLVDEVSQALAVAAADAAKVADQAAHGLTTALEAAGRLLEKLFTAHEEQAAKYSQLQAENQAAGEALQQHREAEQAVADHEKLQSLREVTRQRLQDLRESRKSFKGQFLLEREQISSLRQEVAQGLQADAGTKVRIRVLRNADSSAYRITLLDALKGARVRNHDEILECLMRLRPEQLAQVIADNDIVEFETQTSLGSERCKRILDTYRMSIDPLALEVMPIDDRVNIELNVSNSAEPLFKDASELSRGQKCTALLPLLLARRDSPLLIDQPEDNLDNHFIYETVVESICRHKDRRQMIFVTHNANIPVLAEADLVVVLNSDGKRGFVEVAGPLDDCREQIIDLLEGGRQAFELRRQRYQRR